MIGMGNPNRRRAIGAARAAVYDSCLSPDVPQGFTADRLLPRAQAQKRERAEPLPAAVFADDPAPNGIALASKWFLSDIGVPGRGGDHHHEFKLGVDEDRLAV